MFTPPQSLEDIPSVDALVAAADATVAGLQEAKRRLAWALRRHMVSAFLNPDANHRTVPNILILGATGTGKSFLIGTMLRECGLPFLDINATEYSDVGYQGRDLTSMYAGFVEDKWRGAQKEEGAFSIREMVSLAERYGVVILDEFDKLRIEKSTDGRQVGRKLQAELLKLVEGADVNVKRYDSDRGFFFNTRHVLYIAVGAFEGLPQLMAKIDGTTDPTPAELQSIHLEVEAYDLHRYGLMPELVGRFSSFLPLPDLTPEGIERIIQEQTIPILRSDFALHGIGFVVEPGAMSWISGEVMRNHKSGARSIPPLMEELTWNAASLARPGETIALTPASVQERRSEIWPAKVAA